MVFLLPAFLVNDVGMGDPFFCKYLCPQGVLEGAIPLSLTSFGIRAALGSLFTWKFSLLLAVIVLSIVFYRPFCKWLCPLGTFYALFNRVSLFQMKVDKNKCVSCGKCARACKMDVDVTKTPKDQFTADELKLLQGEAEKIRDIEDKLTMLEEKYPDIAQESIDGDMSVPAGSDMTTPPDDGSMQKFPAFEGKDLDGNTVKSSELFSKNAVTVVNFWFTTCNPCVGELAELDTLNKELTEKGGALIGVNTFTLDGDEAAISEAKNVLAKKGATYQNVYFASDGEAGKFTTNIFAYPTTYVVDRNGNIVGDPIVGAITEKKQAEELQAQIDKALSADMG